jgi:hypothetical protein
MSIEKALKLQAPKLPKDLKDKDIAKVVAALAKSLPPLVTAVGGLSRTLTPALTANFKLLESTKKKHDDKSSDAKTKAAAKELYAACYKIDEILTDLV